MASPPETTHSNSHAGAELQGGQALARLWVIAEGRRLSVGSANFATLPRGTLSTSQPGPLYVEEVRQGSCPSWNHRGGRRRREHRAERHFPVRSADRSSVRTKKRSRSSHNTLNGLTGLWSPCHC